ncbi:putative plasma membrane Na(+) /H(+) antiporter [Tanacetum coccineum]
MSNMITLALKDLVHLHDAIQCQSAVREQIVGSTKETNQQRGVALYKEGSKPNGILVISKGVVKRASKRIRNKQSLRPTFSHGSTLGLYEVMLGKPYICDIVTELGFFIEAERILSMLGTYHAVDDFLWQVR